VIKHGEEVRKIALFKNGHLRLLLSLIGFKQEGLDDDANTPWVIPSSISADQLKQSLDWIKKFEFSPPVFDDGKEAGDFIRRKSAGTATRTREAFDDEDDEIDDDEELMFPAGGPTAMKKSDALEALKKTRRRRRREGTDEEPTGLTDEQLQERADARRARELEKNRKIKSELFVHDSDEESDAERDRIFFAAEEKLRERSRINIMKELLGVGTSKDKTTSSTVRKRQSSAMSNDSDRDDEAQIPSNRKRQSSAISANSDEEVEAGSGRSSSAARDSILANSDEATDTPMSSPHIRSSQAKRRKVSSDELDSLNPLSDDDEDVPVARPPRQRVRSGFIVESSDEEQ
jgi:replication fork protection complex subunit Tof1/Swi1